MQIIHLAASLPPAKGGVETHIAEVTRLQRAAGWQVSWLVSPQPTNKVASWVWIVQQLPTLLAASRLQVHDVFWWLLPVWPLLWLWQLLTGRTTILTFHGWEGKWPIPWQAVWQRRLYSWLAPKVVHVGGWIRDYYGDTPDAVIYGGVTPAQLKPGKLVGKNRTLVFVGRLEAENDIAKYLDLVAELRKKSSSKWEVIWVGDGSYRTVCQTVGRVTGMVDDVARYIDTADTVLASSYLSILQAQARGKLVVALYSHELKKQYLRSYPGSKAMIIGTNPTKVAQQLQAITRSGKEWQRVSEKAYALAAQHLWQKVVDTYDTVVR